MKLQIILSLFFLLMISGVVGAQERVVATSPKATAAPADARFEIIQVQHLRENLLLKLDKYTGEVHEFVRNRDYIRDKGQAFAWQITRRDNKPSAENLDTQRVNFQIFSATSHDNSAYLINVNTGEVWSMVKELGADKETGWVLSKIQKK